MNRESFQVLKRAKEPGPTPNDEFKCRSLQKVHENLETQKAAAEERLKQEECQGPARTICVARYDSTHIAMALKKARGWTVFRGNKDEDQSPLDPVALGDVATA